MTHVLIRSKRILLLTNPTGSLYLSPLMTVNFVAICLTNMSISFPIPPDVLITAAVSVAFSTPLALGRTPSSSRSDEINVHFFF